VRRKKQQMMQSETQLAADGVTSPHSPPTRVRAPGCGALLAPAGIVEHIR